MSTPVRASDRDLRALAAIVSQDRPDLPDGDGLPPSLLGDLHLLLCRVVCLLRGPALPDKGFLPCELIARSHQ